jgi:hypothetical protein
MAQPGLERFALRCKVGCAPRTSSLAAVSVRGAPLQGAHRLASLCRSAGGSKECRLARRHRCAGVGKEYCLARQYRYAGGSHAIRIPCFTMPHETPATPCDPKSLLTPTVISIRSKRPGVGGPLSVTRSFLPKVRNERPNFPCLLPSPLFDCVLSNPCHIPP